MMITYNPAKEEACLTEYLANKCDETRNDLVLSLTPRVKAIAKKVWKRLPPESGVNVEDLEQVGYIATMKCLQRYVPQKAKIHTFMNIVIHGGMMDALRSWDPVTRETRRRLKRGEEVRGIYHRQSVNEGMIKCPKAFATYDKPVTEGVDWLIDMIPAGVVRDATRMRFIDEIFLKDISKTLGIGICRASQCSLEGVAYLKRKLKHETDQ